MRDQPLAWLHRSQCKGSKKLRDGPEWATSIGADLWEHAFSGAGASAGHSTCCAIRR